MDLFLELGTAVESAWRAKNYNEELFPAITAEALRSASIPSKMSAWDVIDWVMGQDSLPPQKDLHGNFGDPPITVYNGSRFYIDVYFWLDGTTALHQHSFCGAFQVFLGSSIHSWYEFDRREAVNAYMEIGDLTLRHCELLNTGDVQEIRAGRQYIHSLFHLDQPSATIVIRTDRSPLSLPQFSYHKPSLAIDPFFENEATTKKLQCISALFKTKRPETDDAVSRLLEQSDLQTSLDILNSVSRLLKHDPVGEMFQVGRRAERFEVFLKIVAERHGQDKADLASAIIDHNEKVDEIVGRRALVTDPEHRFFLALLLNIEGRQRIFDLISQRYPDADPIEKVLDWTYDLGNTRVAGDQKVNVMGIADFGDTDMFALEHLMRGESDEEVVNAFESEYGAERAAVASVGEKAARLRESAIFGPLMQT